MDTDLLPCSSAWIQSWPPEQRRQHPNKTCRSSCPVVTWRLSLGYRVEESLGESGAASKSVVHFFFFPAFLIGFASVCHAVLRVVTSYLQMCPKRVEFILLPVYEHQIISKKRTLGLWPKHTDKAAGVQTLIHVESMSQLVYSLQRTQSQRGSRKVKDFCFINSNR